MSEPRPPGNDGAMQFGAHLPLVDFGQGVTGGAELRAYARTAAAAGYATLSANDHLVWRRPWLDGPTALASVLGDAGDLTLATSVALPTVRHPVVLAKLVTTLARLTDGRVVAGIGPGSSAADHRAVGVPFEERWARFDESLRLVRALVRGEAAPPGRYYPVDDLRLDPLPLRPAEVWCGSWGSDTRLRRMVEVADGWMASAYNTTPERYAAARVRIDGHLAAVGRDPARFPDLIATMWLYVTDDARVADRLLRDVLAPILARDPAELQTQLPIGPPEHCIALLERYAAAGAQQVLLWPIHDPIDQLERFAASVIPAVGRSDAAGLVRGGAPEVVA
jgi:alkanesulfonate monooxygenase SsuD/methylene tetrahydromethanopterin reductase-like flavin-dependent oxidoreductase (luciferase family)